MFEKGYHDAGHILLRHNSTIKSHDGGNGGHFCKCIDIGINLQLARGDPLVGQLFLYLLNDLNSSFSNFTKGASRKDVPGQGEGGVSPKGTK